MMDILKTLFGITTVKPQAMTDDQLRKDYQRTIDEAKKARDARAAAQVQAEQGKKK